MSDDKKDEVMMKSKEIGLFLIKCFMFDFENYIVWVIRMKIVFKVNKVWEVIEFGIKDEDKNNMAIALLFQSISEVLILKFGDFDIVKVVWEVI